MLEYIIFILVILIIVSCIMYNQFVKRNNNVEQAKSTIDANKNRKSITSCKKNI